MRCHAKLNNEVNISRHAFLAKLYLIVGYMYKACKMLNITYVYESLIIKLKKASLLHLSYFNAM